MGYLAQVVREAQAVQLAVARVEVDGRGGLIVLADLAISAHSPEAAEPALQKPTLYRKQAAWALRVRSD